MSDLKREVERLSAEVARLCIRVSDLEETLRLQRELDFEIVHSSRASGYSEASAPASAPASTASVVSGTPAPEGGQSWSERERIAREVGQFLRRALEGSPRGTSGRDRIRVASRLYIICRDIQGTCYNPPVVCSRFSRVKELCFRGSEVGDSVFIGLPSQREVTVCLEAARLQVPATFQ